MGNWVSLLLEQYPVNVFNKQVALKQEVHLENCYKYEEMANTPHSLLPLELQHGKEFACLNGASRML